MLFFYQRRGRPTHNDVLSALDWRGLWSAGNLMGVSSSSYEQLKVAILIAWHFMRYATTTKKKQFADNLCSAIIKEKKTCLSNKAVSHFILLINLFILPWTSSRLHTGHVTRLCSQLASTTNLESPINFFHPWIRTSTGSKLQTERLPPGLKHKMFWLYNNPNHHWSYIFIILTLCIHYIVVSGVSKALAVVIFMMILNI